MQVSKRIRTTTTFYEPTPLDEVECDESSEDDCGTEDWESSSSEEEEEATTSDDDFIAPCQCGKELEEEEEESE